MKTKEEIRQRIKARIRKKLAGTPERPRLAVFRSQSHIYAQVIDDDAGRTVCQASSLDKDAKSGKKRIGFDARAPGGVLIPFSCTSSR